MCRYEALHCAKTKMYRYCVNKQPMCRVYHSGINVLDHRSFCISSSPIKEPRSEGHVTIRDLCSGIPYFALFSSNSSWRDLR